MDAFESCTTSVAMRERLEGAGRAVSILHHQKDDRTDSRRRIDLLEFEVKDYQHLGYEGDLVLQFFNDRLLLAEFLPQDVDGYIDALREKGVDIRGYQGVYLGNAYVWAFTGYRDNRRRVVWQDNRLHDDLMAAISG